MQVASRVVARFKHVDRAADVNGCTRDQRLILCVLAFFSSS